LKIKPAIGFFIVLSATGITREVDKRQRNEKGRVTEYTNSKRLVWFRTRTSEMSLHFESFLSNQYSFEG